MVQLLIDHHVSINDQVLILLLLVWYLCCNQYYFIRIKIYRLLYTMVCHLLPMNIVCHENLDGCVFYVICV